MKDVISLRRKLHQNPELSGKEFQTASLIRDYITSHCTPDQTISLAGHGLAFIYKGREAGPKVLIRAELDALPIQEINDFEYRSYTKGISHKCGHDGHMAILAAVGQHFSLQRPEKGEVILLYQPAEETGEGARAVYEDPVFQNIAPDHVFSLHNVPGYELHKIRCKSGTFTPAVTSMAIYLKGKTSHAAEPHRGLNPGHAIAKIIQKAEKISESTPQSSIITLIHVRLGDKAYGVSAGDGEIHFTMRAIKNEDLEDICDELKNAVETIAEEEKLGVNFKQFEHFMANINDAPAVDIIKQSALKLGYDYEEMEVPNPWGEDFGYINSHYQGAMFGLGAGKDHPALHNPDYDFPDELVESGSQMFIEMIYKAMEEKIHTDRQCAQSA